MGVVVDRIRVARSSHDLRDYIAADLGLRIRKGQAQYIQVPCPFHHDSDPSLAVYKGNYFCFGCNAKGDIVDWIRHRDKGTINEALEALDGPAPLMPSTRRPPPPPEAVKSVGMERLGLTMEAITNEARSSFGESKAANYAEGRGWKEPTQEAYQMGYLPWRAGESSAFKDHLALQELGLLNRDGWPWINDRLLVPILNLTQEPVAFATRDLTQNPSGPRYINSRRTSIFHRDETLYGLRQLRIGQPYCFVVEGYADVWSLHSLGIPGVAIMGDHLTEPQLDMLASLGWLYGRRIVLAFDGDAEGQKGEADAYERVLARGLHVSRMNLRRDVDVSDLVAEASEWNELSSMVEFLDWRCT